MRITKSHFCRQFVLAAAIGCALALPARAEVTTVDSFEMMGVLAYEFTQGDLGSLLVVMDDDDTLTQVPCTDPSAAETCQYLGGPAWYSWQESLIGATPANPYQIAQSEDDLIALAAMLFGLMDMGYTDPGIPLVLTDLAGGGYGANMLVLTARGGSDISPTQTQFGDLEMATGTQSFADFIAANALVAGQSGAPSLASPLVMDTPASCATSRAVTYTAGVLYGAGQDKGKLLRCLLARTEADHITHIVFVDDTLKNVQNVAAAFPPGAEGPQVLPLFYTRLEAHKAALTTGPDAARLQQIADARWDIIRAALLDTLLSPLPELR